MVNSAEFFGYQVGENGRLILPGLTEEETLEFEILSRRRDDRPGLSSEMRELELFLRQYNAVRARSADEGTPRRNVVDHTTPAYPFHGPVQAQQRRIDRPTFPIARQRLAILMTLSLMAAGLVTIVLATGF